MTSFLGFPLPIVLDITDQNVSDCHRDYHGTALGENIPWYSTGETYHGTVLVLGEIYVPWHSARTGGNIHSKADFFAHKRFGKSIYS